MTTTTSEQREGAMTTEAEPITTAPSQLDMLDAIYGQRECYLSHEIATARRALALFLREDVRAFSEALGFGDGKTEPAATLDQMVDPLLQALSDGREHIECPIICEPCGERLADQTCEKCHGGGCLPNAALAHLECDICAGAGKIHANCIERGYDDLARTVGRVENLVLYLQPGDYMPVSDVHRALDGDDA